MNGRPISQALETEMPMGTIVSKDVMPIANSMAHLLRPFDPSTQTLSPRRTKMNDLPPPTPESETFENGKLPAIAD